MAIHNSVSVTLPYYAGVPDQALGHGSLVLKVEEESLLGFYLVWMSITVVTIVIIIMLTPNLVSPTGYDKVV